MRDPTRKPHFLAGYTIDAMTDAVHELAALMLEVGHPCYFVDDARRGLLSRVETCQGQ